MKKFNGSVLVSLVVVVALGLTGLIRAATTVSLGTADSFAILAGSGITIAAPNATVITGDIGSYSTTTITGLENLTLTGTNHAGDATTQLAKTALTSAYNNVAGQTPATTLTESTTNSFDVTGTTLAPGIYKSASTLGFTGTLTLNGSATDVWIFQAGSSLTTAGSSIVNLTGGAQACNVFWQVGSSATLGAGSVFKGNILALTDISLGTTANLSGRALAQNGAVTLAGTNTIAIATCAIVATPVPDSYSRPAATINVVKTVINDNGGTKVVADFPLFVNGTPVVSGVTNTFPAPALAYTITETGDSNYTRTFSGDCANGQIALNPGDNKFCIVINNDIGAPIVVPPVPPLIDVVKTASPLSLPAGSGPVTYTYTLSNIGTVPMTNITMVGDTCSPIILAFGDTNSDSRLDLSETWRFTCSTTLSATHTNTVVATGWANGISAVDIASATVVVGAPIVPPLIHVTKVPNPLTLPAGGGMVTYTKKVTNPGTVALSNIRLTDDMCGPVTYVSGDANSDSKLDTSETWVYSCRANLAQTTVNTVTASGDANGLTARDFALATVVVATPKLPNTGIDPNEKSFPWNLAILSGILILISIPLRSMVIKNS